MSCNELILERRKECFRSQNFPKSLDTYDMLIEIKRKVNHEFSLRDCICKLKILGKLTMIPFSVSCVFVFILFCIINKLLISQDSPLTRPQLRVGRGDKSISLEISAYLGPSKIM